MQLAEGRQVALMRRCQRLFHAVIARDDGGVHPCHQRLRFGLGAQAGFPVLAPCREGGLVREGAFGPDRVIRQGPESIGEIGALVLHQPQQGLQQRAVVLACLGDPELLAEALQRGGVDQAGHGVDGLGIGLHLRLGVLFQH